MLKKNCLFFLIAAAFFSPLVSAQTHVSVPLDHSVYYILNLAETRGLCSPLPSAKPYTRGRIAEAIDEIMSAEPGRFGALTDAEMRILAAIREEFRKGEAGPDLKNGRYRFDVEGKKGYDFSGDVGITLESLNSAAYYRDDKKTYLNTDTWGTIFTQGDVGENFSFRVDLYGGLLTAERNIRGTYDTYATEFVPEDPPDGIKNQRVDTYGHPLAFFPYSYQKRWDGFLLRPGHMSATSMFYWPDSLSIGSGMQGEIAGNAFGDLLFLRFGRLRREWGAMAPGNSLILNGAARPFLGVETTFNPVPWFSFSSITGVLEYYNFEGGIYEGAEAFQNAFSLYQLEFNYKNYFHVDVGSAAVWLKRFELGYLFPLIDNFLYQNFVGKFDNAALHMNMRYRYPGLGSLWFSVFMEEVEVASLVSNFKLDRQMFAFQVGLQGMIYGLPFASFAVSYTKIEPYAYTHQRNNVPWYGKPMKKAYVNNGVGLGYYLPPNSDEIKVRVDIPFGYKIASHFQYQMIRHGADFGRHQVDGSSLVSELDPDGRGGEKYSLRKKFLKDGAYEWTHIFKIGGEYRFASLPLTIFGETGIAYSYFTDISDEEYKIYNPIPREETLNDRKVEGSYLRSMGFFLTLGFRVFK